MIRLRPATAADENRLFEWVNRPDSLTAKLFTHGPIARSTHDAWFAARLADPKTRLWIVEDHAGQALGQVRLQGGADGYGIDVYICAEHRRTGIAHRAIRLALSELGAAYSGERVVARVLNANRASHALFLGLGFHLAETHPDHVVYCWTVSP